MITIPYKKINPSAWAPEKAHEGDAGWDLRAVSRKMCPVTRTVIYGTGLAFAMPRGCWLEIRARSSVYQHGLILSNGVGTVDAGYRGEVSAAFYLASGHPCEPYHVGDRICQALIMPLLASGFDFVEVENLPESPDGRGTGGYGSTGR